MYLCSNCGPLEKIPGNHTKDSKVKFNKEPHMYDKSSNNKYFGDNRDKDRKK